MAKNCEMQQEKSRPLRGQLTTTAMACLLFYQAGINVGWALNPNSLALVYAPFGILLAATWLSRKWR